MPEDEQAGLVRAVDLVLGGVGLLPGGSLLAAVVNQWPAVQRMRAQLMLEQLLEMLGEPEAGLVRRLEGEPRALQLVASAVGAATLAETQAKVRALAQVAVTGLADDARLDESAFLISRLREVEVIDVRLLLEIEARDLKAEQGADTQQILGVSLGVAEALNAKLLQLALVETPGMSFRGLHREVRLAPLGIELLALLRATGQGDPLG